MKTILEIQKIDMQIRSLMRQVEKSPESVKYKQFRNILAEGRVLFEQMEAQAREITKAYERALNKLSQYKGDSEILKKRNVASSDLETTEGLVQDFNSLLGDISEENRKIEDLVRKSEELNRKSNELSAKLTEAKMRRSALKEIIEKKKADIAPKIAELENKIKQLESKVEDKEKYEKYKDLKAKNIFPAYVTMEENFCGRCKMELSLNFVEKLKTKGMLPCEHCGSIIMLNKN